MSSAAAAPKVLGRSALHGAPRRCSATHPAVVPPSSCKSSSLILGPGRHQDGARTADQTIARAWPPETKRRPRLPHADGTRRPGHERAVEIRRRTEVSALLGGTAGLRPQWRGGTRLWPGESGRRDRATGLAGPRRAFTNGSSYGHPRRWCQPAPSFSTGTARRSSADRCAASITASPAIESSGNTGGATPSRSARSTPT